MTINIQRSASPCAVAAAALMLCISSCSTARRNTTVDEERPRVVDAATKARTRVLRVGDRAPGLVVDEWVKGEPVECLEEDKLYVVVFWATWCSPAVTTLPHLSALQRDHAAVTFIGVAANEKLATPGVDDRTTRLRDFVKRQGSRVDFRMAFDREGAMRAAWADETGAEALPRAFIVDRDGRIAWIGHPVQMEPALQAVVLESR